MRSILTYLSAAAALLTLGARPTQAGTISFFVTVNTSSVNGTSGFLDFQFNPGDISTQAATAQVLNFTSTGGSFSGVPQVDGNVVGTLPGTVSFLNSTALNEYFQGFNYGTGFSFLLSLSGPAIDSPNGTSTAGSTFGLGLYDGTQQPILTDQSATSGLAGKVDINLDGTATTTAFPNGLGPTVVTITSTPEPASMLLLVLGLASLSLLRRVR